MHLFELTVQVVLVHVEVVTCEDVAINTRINRVKVGTLLSSLAMSDNLLIPCDVS